MEMRVAEAAGAMAAVVLLATFGGAAAAATSAAAPALMLRRAAPLNGLDHLQKLDRARLAKRSGVVEFGLLGLPGIYYTNVRLGSPSKEYTLQFDTGSDLMWVSCSSCTGCPATNDLGIPLEFYRPSSSSTTSNISCADDRCIDAVKEGHSVCQTSDSPTNQCGYQVAYGNAATSGYYVSDTMHFDTVMGKGNEQLASSSASVLFGCSTSRSSNLQTDGIMGFGKNAPSVILQLNSQGVSPKAFSHCLTSSQDGGGILVLGAVAEPGIEFSPLVPSQARYNLNMKSIDVNGQKVSINSSLFTTSNTQGTFVDSGTSLSYLADGVYDPVISAIDNAVPQSIRSYFINGHLCYIISSRINVSLFPILTLHFEGGSPMTVDPANYLLLKGGSASPDNESLMCIGFLRSKELEAYRHITILGGSQLNKTTVPVTVPVGSGSSRRRTPSYGSGLTALVVVVISINIIFSWRPDSWWFHRQGY
ncbi:aspartic proteinase 36 isoform X2 [Lolium perenne]|uniref:aspartic proteinase 36 isoform X2 n=1 Tax=Lolium perenne TaxID=4522 RepID=UPI0021F63744|nr:aspartic proteinase 36-like isoform X2 [Lolium perenne]